MELNHRPRRYERPALTTELLARRGFSLYTLEKQRQFNLKWLAVQFLVEWELPLKVQYFEVSQV